MSSEDADHDASGRRRSHAYAAEDEEDDPLGINSFNNGDEEVVPKRKTRKAAAPKKPGLSQQTLSIINDLAPHTLDVPRPESESEEEAAAEERMREEEEAKRRHRDKVPAKKPKKTRKKKEEPAEEEDRAFDHYVKILLLGDQAVGKTSLMLRWSENRFEPSLISTAGVDFKIKFIDVDGKRVKCQVWDTAGQERFHVITRAFYKGAHGILLLYDVTDSRTFQNVGYWMNNIQQHAAPGVEKMLIANKIDMADARMIPEERGRAEAEQYGMHFGETSAKEGTNVDTLLLQIVRSILANPDASTSAAAEAAAASSDATDDVDAKGGKKKDCVIQ
eukprot:CAMPEP_0196781188 /NCGR_PEP_ID=MMETSP1104-20130614/9213_1 /TAXON_ID=33652 /ORGANISM="Cafeteria sp., Strain Caron Lab Isolate" /LENGTH=332 /DNA_ID=CAMNT_0042151409 /DNA_START=99 /DNA_END=1097 /DNA_ORIENTATION=+